MILILGINTWSQYWGSILDLNIEDQYLISILRINNWSWYWGSILDLDIEDKCLISILRINTWSRYWGSILNLDIEDQCLISILRINAWSRYWADQCLITELKLSLLWRDRIKEEINKCVDSHKMEINARSWDLQRNVETF